jgi:ribonuclease HI
MPEHPTPPPNPHTQANTTTTSLRILQLNLNKSEKAHLELFNNVGKDWDIVLLQEPHIINNFNAIRTPTNYRPVFPEDRGRNGATVRSVIWVSSEIDTASWEIINVPNTNDITAIQLKGEYGKLTIINVYNDCTHSASEVAIGQLMRRQAEKIRGDENSYVIWAGDFNRHHPLWDRDEDTHLFTGEAQRAAERLINLVAEHDMEMLLPKGIPTLEHMRTKKYSRPDNVFASPGTQDFVDKCDTDLSLHPPCTDHFPITTTLTLPQQKSNPAPRYNFREADWDSFRKTLTKKLAQNTKPAPLTNIAQLNKAANEIMNALQETVEECIKRSKPRPHSKRWWNSDLKKMQKALNRLRVDSYRNRTLTSHPSHDRLRKASNEYGEAIVTTKKQHWTSYLEEMTANNIWTANRYLKEPSGDGGNPRIPTIRARDDANGEILVSDNNEKAKFFAKTFFPPPPPDTLVPLNHKYPAPLPPPPQITAQKIEEQIRRLSPYKAPGPDEIPNIVLQKCLDMIQEYLLHIFRAILDLGVYYDPWREFTYLLQRIKGAWRKDMVVSVLFLDIEGAFPNAVTDRLIHNLRRRRIPTAYVTFIQQLLANRRTKLKFDDYTSEAIYILNGIGQGDPLSMLLYIIYNADLLQITGDENTEDSLGFVDDIALIAIGKDFEETTRRLRNMMTKEDGGLQWSKEHNSMFEVNKSVILHASRRTQKNPEDDHSQIPLDRPTLTLQGQEIQEVQSYKYLGIQIDAQLRWKEQAQRVAANATKWILQYRRLTRPSTGVSNKLMRQLYIAVALPKITYGLSTWYTPPHKPAGATKNTGSVAALKTLQKVQRLATLAITGALRSTPTDLLDAHAGVLPMELALSKVCFGSTIRLLTLPETHPIWKIVEQARQAQPKKHPGLIDLLVWNLKLETEKLETITPIRCSPSKPVKFKIAIPGSREESMEDEKGDTSDFKIYADGSGHDGGVGAAAVIYKRGERRPTGHRKAHLGSGTKHNTYEGETVGGILALWLVGATPHTAGKKVTVYLDNQAVLKSVVDPKATSGQHLLQALKTAANNSPAKIELKWISRHSGVPGNERADVGQRSSRGKRNQMC